MSPPQIEATVENQPWNRAGGYREWVERHLAIAADTLVVERPGPEAVVQIRAAWRRGVERVICGFLPDEQRWSGGGYDAFAAWVGGRLDFVPWVFEVAAAPSSSGRSLAFIHDEDAGDELAVVASAWAAGWGLEMRDLDSSRLPPSELAAAVAGSAVVVNGVADWSLGFAVDHCAARYGRPCARLHNPGYSPLRYALLGQSLVRQQKDFIARLRPVLKETVPSAARTGLGDDGAWFEPGTAMTRWRSVFSGPGVDGYWRGMDRAEIRFRATVPFDGWLDHVLAWPALALSQREAFPPAAAARVRAAMTAWLTDDVRNRVRGSVRHLGLARWLHLYPEWIAEFRALLGDGPDCKAAVAGWAARSLLWQETDRPALPLLRATAWALDWKSGTASVAWLARMASGSWRMAADEVCTGGKSAPEIRTLLTHIIAESLAEDVKPSRSVEPIQGWRELLDDSASWTAICGIVTPVVQLLGALRLGDRGAASNAWRACMRAAKTRNAGGIARLARTAFAGSADFLPWLLALIREPAGGEPMIMQRLLAVWYRRRLWSLWRVRVDCGVQHELETALRLQTEIAESGVAGSAAWNVLASWRALSARGTGVEEALERFAATGGELTETVLSRALSRWLRGDNPAALRLLARWPAPTVVPARVQFLEAVVWQLLGDIQKAEAALEKLSRSDPAYFADTPNRDVRWAWAAVVMRRAGCDVAQLQARAVVATPGSEGMIGDVDVGHEPLAAGWLKLISASNCLPPPPGDVA